MATTVSIKTLLDAGVHFGHQTRRWNPKMKPYIFGQRNGMYILDLKQTLYALDEAYSQVAEIAASGKQILFVGTKKQAQATIKEQACRCGMPYVDYRWMGGMLTNYKTINDRVKYMEKIEDMVTTGVMSSYTKKEQAQFAKEHEKLQLALGGIREMNGLPAAIFVIDTKLEENAVREACRLNIPIIGLLDTNADPDEVDFGIPANDDAIRSIELLTTVIADAVIAGSGVEISVEEMSGNSEPNKATTIAEIMAADEVREDTETPSVEDTETPSVEETETE